jgi:hypothetical protein
LFKGTPCLLRRGFLLEIAAKTMMTDGVKVAEKEESTQVLDIAEIVAANMK